MQQRGSSEAAARQHSSNSTSRADGAGQAELAGRAGLKTGQGRAAHRDAGASRRVRMVVGVA